MISQSEEIYKKLSKDGIEILYDDRKDVSAGEKFADCDLIGIPVRLVVSQKIGKGKVEIKDRSNNKVEVMAIDQVVLKLSRDTGLD